MPSITIALAQISSDVGDFDGNSAKIVERAREAARAGADIVVFPELCLTGYPPEDYLLKPDFGRRSVAAMEALSKEVGDVIAVVGYPEADYDLFNSAAVISRGEVRCTYRKVFLPNYGVFDEKRYFGTGNRHTVLDLGGVRVGITICEDIWYAGGPMEEQVAQGGAQIILNLSASPFNRGKYDHRRKLLEARALDGPAVVAYCNTVGAQDELVFDGGSCVCHPDRGFIASAARFCEEMLVCEVDLDSLQSRRLLEPRFRHGASPGGRNELQVCRLERPASRKEHRPAAQASCAPLLSLTEEIFDALVLGLKEYVRKNGFEKVVLGLSGGIDSALVAALAVQALGAKNVVCVFLPSRYTAVESGEDARGVAENLGATLLEIPIEDLQRGFAETLEPILGGEQKGVTYENLQARIRGNLLMALSNTYGWLVLATGNKSELSMGYCTLYGDMAGGFALIKDLLKTQVYEVAEFVNSHTGREVIPRSIISRPPTAELRPNQLDTDSLPPYNELDPILEAYVEEGMSPDQIVEKGFEAELVGRIVKTVDSNEYKRRQAPVGVKITPRAFGRDWRMPISL